MPTTRLVLLLMSVMLLGFAPAPFPRTVRSRVDQTDVGGTWEFITWEYRGTRHQELEKSYKAQMTREKFELVTQGGTWVMRLDPTTTPPSFTWTMSNRVTHVGSYRLNGHEITMVFADGMDVTARPTDLGSSQNGWRFVMRRVNRD